MINEKEMLPPPDDIAKNLARMIELMEKQNELLGGVLNHLDWIGDRI